MSYEPDRAEGSDDLPEELARILRELTGGADLPPQMVEQLKAMGLADADPAVVSAMAQQVKAMFAPGPVTKGVDVASATDVARQIVAAEGGDAAMGSSEHALAEQATRIAGLWLDQATSLEAPSLTGAALSRAEWVEATLPTWADLVDPVAEGLSAAIRDSIGTQMQRMGDSGADLAALGLPPGMNLDAISNQMAPMVQRMSSSLITAQLAQAVGALAGETVTGTEVGIPIVQGRVALLPANIALFADGLGVDLDEVWLHLALREAARMRLFTAVPWLGPQILATVQEYSRGMAIDTDAIDAAVSQINPSDPEALQEALTGSFFQPQPSAIQQAALTRLETWLALIEGWVDHVAARASADHLPNTAAMAETIRRRRATGGPAEKTFAGLVGLELRPRRLRDAANLWAALEDAHGASARDAAWDHPDVAPRAEDLDDPLGYVERFGGESEGTDLDAELDALLRDESGE